ncbi:RNA polymerase sigma factor [Nonomuraea antimicrobica]
MHVETIERLGTAALVSAAQDGDAVAWERLVEEFSPMLRARIRRFRLSHEDAQDVLQTTWLLAWQNLRSVEDGQRMAGWLATIAFRECLKLNRRTRRSAHRTSTRWAAPTTWTGNWPGSGWPAPSKSWSRSCRWRNGSCSERSRKPPSPTTWTWRAGWAGR